MAILTVMYSNGLGYATGFETGQLVTMERVCDVILRKDYAYDNEYPVESQLILQDDNGKLFSPVVKEVLDKKPVSTEELLHKVWAAGFANGFASAADTKAA